MDLIQRDDCGNEHQRNAGDEQTQAWVPPPNLTRSKGVQCLQQCDIVVIYTPCNWGLGQLLPLRPSGLPCKHSESQERTEQGVDSAS